MICAASWNVRGLNGVAHQRSFGHLVGVEILLVELQFIHCRVTSKKEHTKCLIIVLYGDNDVIPGRDLWNSISQLSNDITDEPWLLIGDFNAVIDESEISEYAADTSASMGDFLNCITTAELIHLPFMGANLTWHNSRNGDRSLWKRLYRMLVNETWLVHWSQSIYISASPRTSDHSPLILQGHDRCRDTPIFRFDNFMTKLPGFLDMVKERWKHPIIGTSMYALTRKLKYLKSMLRGIKRQRGNLSQNIQKAAEFLLKAQQLIQEFQHDTLLLQLEKWCRIIYCKAVNLETIMLKQRAKLNWLKW
ncbi:UNVERIFIED_CONTAM: hypothetical protein Slati_2941300 [Sesamum latifolium]|uniref:Endonuclease/exonuclease/phosphatase domain-containing protein n=1 Tax=Sesamum latifolium TaxID=2727402 RepID=A0AAW2VHA8_9LAMI